MVSMLWCEVFSAWSNQCVLAIFWARQHERSTETRTKQLKGLFACQSKKKHCQHMLKSKQTGGVEFSCWANTCSKSPQIKYREVLLTLTAQWTSRSLGHHLAFPARKIWHGHHLFQGKTLMASKCGIRGNVDSGNIHVDVSSQNQSNMADIDSLGYCRPDISAGLKETVQQPKQQSFSTEAMKVLQQLSGGIVFF